MGCHTLFNNSLDCIPDKDYQKLKEVCIDNINKSTIMNCDYDKWVKTITSWNLDGRTKKKCIQKDFYDKRLRHLNWAKEVLEADNPNKDAVISVLKEFGGLVYEDSYDLSKMGWRDQYRVFGYPNGKFTNPEEAIYFLINYDQEKISFNLKTGYCEEIGNIINRFFTEYPNGYIEYG